MRIYPGTTVDYEFATLGGLGYTGTLNDRQFAALRAEGLTGSLPDMFGAVYTPVAEPAPSAAKLAEHTAATEYTHDWSNLTGWTVSNMQVNSNQLYSDGSGTNPSAVYRPFAVAAGESARMTCEVVRVTGVNRAIYVGFETVGGSILASLPNFCGVGINGTDDFEAYIGANFTGGVPTGNTNLGTRSGSGTYTVTVSADPDYVSLVVRMADSSDEGVLVIPRSSLPGGGAIAGVTFWNTDTRGLTGSYIKGFGVRKSLTPFVTKTVTGATIEGTSAQVIHRGTSGNYWRVHLPKAMDGTFAHPICLFTHQASTGDRNSVWQESRALPVLEALDAAGYIVISADDGDKWGNQASIDNYLEAVQWVRDNFYAGPLVLWSPSMGGTPAWNIVLRREAHVRAIAAICPVCDTEEMYRSPFVAGLDAAYGVSDLTGLQAALAASGGYNPLDGNMVEFTGKGVKFWVGTGTSDTTVPEALHAVPMQAALAPYAAESDLIEIGSGHLASSQYDATAIVALFDTYT